LDTRGGFLGFWGWILGSKIGPRDGKNAIFEGPWEVKKCYLKGVLEGYQVSFNLDAIAPPLLFNC